MNKLHPANLIFDFGGVLIDWNPHYVYDPYFGDRAKADWFLTNICTMEWNGEVDAGKPMAEATAELVARFPEWKKEIEMYFGRWIEMIGKAIPGMYELLLELKARGHRLFGLSNWSAETFVQIKEDFPALKLLDGMVVSGYVKCLKPSPEIYRLLLDRYSLKASDCVFIDDNAANIAGAEAVGIHGILFTGPSDLRRQLL